MKSLRMAALALVATAGVVIASQPALADAGEQANPYGYDWPGRNDLMGIARISHRHATDGDVVYQVVFRHGFPKSFLVGRFSLFFDLTRGTAPAFPSSPGWQEDRLLGHAVDHGGRILLQLSSYDEDAKHGMHDLARVPLRKVRKTVTMRFPPSWLAAPPFSYRWQAQTSLGQVSQDLTSWLPHSIGRGIGDSLCGHRFPHH